MKIQSEEGYGASGVLPLKVERHLCKPRNILQGSNEETLTPVPTGNVGKSEGWVEGASIK